MERLKMMKENLISCVQSQMGDMKNVDAKELGEAVDMIKDLEEAIYYCTIVEAMQKEQKEPEMASRYYTPYYTKSPYDDMMYNRYRDMDRNQGQMYYTPGGNQGNTGPNQGQGVRYYSYPQSHNNDMYPMHVHDFREGRSPISRKNYMESKEMHKDANTQMQELEKYMMELSQDITEMIKDATPEEKQLLHQKIVSLAEKI